MTAYSLSETDLARFESKVERSDRCWLWRGTIHVEGYGHFSLNSKAVPAHRVAYQVAKGPIPEGLQIDHLCKVRNCVNPDHLEAVTQRVNVLRGDGACAQHARATHCRSGHPLSGDNLRHDNRGQRVCITCARRRGNEYARKRRAAR